MSVMLDHYENLLGPHYTAMAGGFEVALAREAARLASLGLRPVKGKTALDLGCGSGFQTVALARLGYAVTALDLSSTLLTELRGHASALPVETIEGDMLDAAHLTKGRTFDLVTCMGDTLTHLPSHADAFAFCASLPKLMGAGACLILTFRDLTETREGLDRFLPLTLSDDLMMTCFLEYNVQTVRVHDLVHHHDEDGWHFNASAYDKLRLAPEAVVAALVGGGLSIVLSQNVQGFITLVATK